MSDINITKLDFTEKLIDFALNFRTEDIPQEVLDFQKTVLIDSIGVMTAASTLEPAVKPFLQYAAENGGGRSTIFGTGQKTSRVMAAMANGALIHALDYEDGHDVSHAHPNTASIPALLAYAEAENKDGREVLAAMVIASELSVRLKMCLTGNDIRDCGWYAPPMFASYGAVLGLSRLIGLSKEETLDALSICVTQISLPGQSARSRDSVLRGVREALSAKAAAFGVEMARRGVKARMDQPFEGPFGLFMAYFRNLYDPQIVFDGLGTRWECTALRFKAWPCCGTTHGVVDAITSLLQEEPIDYRKVKRVHIHVNKPHINLLEPAEAKYRPASLAAAKFSLPFTIALVLKDGNVTLNSYREQILSDPEILRLMDTVTYELMPEDTVFPEGSTPDDFVKVEITTEHGTYVARNVISSGSPKKPLSRQQLLEKFKDCMSFGSGTYDTDAIIRAVDCLDKEGSVKELFARL